LCEVNRELLEFVAGHSEFGGFLRGAIDIPMVNRQALNEPHCSRTIPAGTMDESRIATAGRDRIEKFLGHGGIRIGAVKRDVVVTHATFFAAASSASTFAPSSLASLKLMIDANPIFLISGTASALVAPAQATLSPAA